jgi:hypothetical protein
MQQTNLHGDYLRLSVPEKKKDKDWFKYQKDRIIPAHLSSLIQDYHEMDRLYRFMGNDLSGFKSEVAYYCGSMEQYGATEEQLVPYNPVQNKFEVLKGDMLSRSAVHNNYSLLTSKVRHKKDKEFIEAIRRSVDQELELSVVALQLEQQGMPPEEISKQIDAMRTAALPQNIEKKNFAAQGEITFSKVLRHVVNDQEVKRKKLESLEDVLTVSRTIIHCGWKYGKPTITVVNPLHVGFHKNPNEPKLEKGDYVYYRDEITLADALQEYANDLSDDELRQLIGSATTVGSTNSMNHMDDFIFDHTRHLSLLDTLGERLYRGTGLAQGNALTNANIHKTLWRVHCEFKAFEEVIYRSHTDEFGEKVTERFSSDADIIPSNASRIEFTNEVFEKAYKYVWVDELLGIEYEAEILSIPRRYQFTLLQPDILIKYGKVPFQPEYAENPFSDFELSYKGRILFNRNTKWLSPLQKALPYIFQYMTVKRIMDRELSSYVGHEVIIDTDQIPDEVGLYHEQSADPTEDPILKNDIIARQTKRRYFSGSRTKTGLAPQSTRSAGVQHAVVDTSAQITNLQNLAQLLSIETGMALGIPPQREGMTVQNTNVTDNRQNLVQSTLATQTIFFYVDSIWNSAINEHMKNMLTFIKLKSESLPYSLETILPDNSKELIEVLPEHVEFMEDLGLTLESNGKEQFYFDVMMQNVFSFAQNAGEGAENVSAILKALVTSSSASEVHDMIEKATAKQQARLAEQQQREAAMQQKLAEDSREAQRYAAELALEGKLKEQQQRGMLAAKQADIQADMMKRQADVDNNNVADQIELNREKMAFDAKENQKDRELEITLAKMKPKPTSK